MTRPGQLHPARLALSLVGLTFLLLASFFAEDARDHMAAIGQVCGGSAPHCGACYAAVGSALGSLLAMAAALRPQPRAVRIRAGD